MGNKKSKRSSKKCKSKKSRENNSKKNISQQEKKSQKLEEEYIYETIVQDSAEDTDVDSDIHTDSNKKNTPETSTDTQSETETTETTDNTTTTTDENDYCEEIKAKQQELLNNLKNITEALTSITSIRDNVNFIRVDNLTEIYFTRQVRPLLDALNIISFAANNMTTAAQNIQINTFGDRKEIRHALSLSYKMNDEVEDIIRALGRRLTIFLKQIDTIDKNCPPFDSGKDS